MYVKLCMWQFGIGHQGWQRVRWYTSGGVRWPPRVDRAAPPNDVMLLRNGAAGGRGRGEVWARKQQGSTRGRKGGLVGWRYSALAVHPTPAGPSRRGPASVCTQGSQAVTVCRAGGKGMHSVEPPSIGRPEEAGPAIGAPGGPHAPSRPGKLRAGARSRRGSRRLSFSRVVQGVQLRQEVLQLCRGVAAAKGGAPARFKRSKRRF